MSKEVKWKDPTQYHEAVIAYREQFNLQMNAGFRRDVAVTVRTQEDLLIWQELLGHWGYMKDGKWHKRSPLDVKGMLTVFEMKVRENERRKMEAANATAKKYHGQESLPDNHRPRLSKRSASNVSEMPSQPERVYF